MSWIWLLDPGPGFVTEILIPYHHHIHTTLFIWYLRRYQVPSKVLSKVLSSVLVDRLSLGDHPFLSSLRFPVESDKFHTGRRRTCLCETHTCLIVWFVRSYVYLYKYFLYTYHTSILYKYFLWYHMIFEGSLLLLSEHLRRQKKSKGHSDLGTNSYLRSIDDII